MELHHSFVLPVPFDEAWEAFNDLDSLVPCVPGASLLSREGDSFTGAVKVKLGPISMLYGGTGAFLERDKASGRIVVEAKGKDKRGNGTAGATVVAQVTAAGANTSVEVSTDLAVTGKPAQFGRGVIQDVSDKLLGQFVDAFVAKMAPDAAGEAVVGESTVETTAEDTVADEAPIRAANPPDAPAPDVPEDSPTAAQARPADSPLATPVETAGIPADAPATTQSAPAQTTPTENRAAQPAPTSHPVAPAPGNPSASKPAELNLLSTVLPILARRYALPAALVVAAIVIVVWIWVGS
jgi:uncharacterized protein